MKVGDLVKYKDDGDVGVITKTVPVSFRGDEPTDYYVEWFDGTSGYHLSIELEVV
mgnify:CR=1 FL=1|tara:strand:- start:673 stop:837 length:165 start_codon:yes stop_codon:yes gene_type:complete